MAAAVDVFADSVMSCDRCCARGLAAPSAMPLLRSTLSGSGCASSVAIGWSANAASTPRSSSSRSAVIGPSPNTFGTWTSRVASVQTGTFAGLR